MTTKICSKCKEEKNVSEFGKRKENKDGLCGRCILCMRKSEKAYRESHPNKYKEYHQEHKKELKENRKDYFIEYRAKPEVIKRKTDWHRNKYRTDPIYRIKCNLRTRLWSALKYQAIKERKHTLDYLGCSIDNFKKYIESKFQPGMTWDNHGRYGWHIDHIKPCALFDLTNPEEQNKCFHYTNLQPLWAKDNWSKNSFYNGKLIRRRATYVN